MNPTEHIRTIADFPKPGIQFYDISTLPVHSGAWQAITEISHRTKNQVEVISVLR